MIARRRLICYSDQAALTAASPSPPPSSSPSSRRKIHRRLTLTAALILELPRASSPPYSHHSRSPSSRRPHPRARRPTSSNLEPPPLTLEPPSPPSSYLEPYLESRPDRPRALTLTAALTTLEQSRAALTTLELPRAAARRDRAIGRAREYTTPQHHPTTLKHNTDTTPLPLPPQNTRKYTTPLTPPHEQKHNTNTTP